MADIAVLPCPLELAAEGLQLRPWRADDAHALYEATRESIASVSPWLPWLTEGYGLADAEHWIEQCAASMERADAYAFGIFDMQGRALGDIAINRVDLRRRSANLGYWVRSSAQGHGIATRAAKALAGFGFGTLGLVRIEIVVAVDNLPSRRVAERLGSHFDGISPNRIIHHDQATPAAVYSLLPPAADTPSPGPVLEEDALRVRPYRMDDAPAVLAALHESMESIGRWQAWCTPSYNLDDARRWIARSRLAWQGVGDEGALAIVDRATDALAGSIALNHWQVEYRMANLGYWVRQSRQGQGIASQAVRMLARHALNNAPLERLEIVAAVGNMASRRVAENAGARLEGIARRRLPVHDDVLDAAIYSLVAGDLG